MITLTPQYLRSLADNVDAFCTNRNCDEIAQALRALADERERAESAIPLAEGRSDALFAA